MPPISWTSKCRMPSARFDASRTTAERLRQHIVQIFFALQSLAKL